MELHPLNALSPLDGRYHHQTQPLSAYFSEQALMRYRLYVEVEYLIALAERNLPPLPPFSADAAQWLRSLYQNFEQEAAVWVKSKEAEVNHDVKAIEYYLKHQLAEFAPTALAEELLPAREFVHFGLTSQDINNTAFPLMLRDALQHQNTPTLQTLLERLEQKAAEWRATPLLARTHGQPASPTGLGKEVEVFAVRLRKQLTQLAELPYPAKFGGATGNFNAHRLAFPQVDWPTFAQELLENRLGLQRSAPTTQIEHYDGLAALFDNLRRVNVVLLDLCRDFWTYISLGYFGQQIRPGEVGSSAMPHKVNPIDFENAEGNLGLANALLDHLSNKLPISRLQRDLTDSTVLRNLGIPLGHQLLALNSLNKGLDKLKLNPQRIQQDLDNHWEVLAEAVQTLLRANGCQAPYELLRDLTRTGQHLDPEAFRQMVQSLPVDQDLKNRLIDLRPETYVGYALEPPKEGSPTT